MVSSDHNSTKQSIISSLFSPNSKGSAGQTGQSYISHCKTWEEVPGSSDRKPRFILLAVSSTLSQIFLHKSKRNSNGTFSIGKTWDLLEFRSIELIDDSAFQLVIGPRPYTWFAENVLERSQFVNLLIRAFRQFTKGKLPIMIGLPNDDYISPAYPTSHFISPATPVNSVPSQSRGNRSINPLTSPQPTPLASAAGLHSPAPPFTSVRSNSPSSAVPPTSLASNSPSSASVSSRSAQPHTTIVPSIPSALPQSINLSTPDHSHESPRRHYNADSVTNSSESPKIRPLPIVNNSLARSSVEEDSRSTHSSGSPRKPSRPKVSILGLGANSRAATRPSGSAAEGLATNRIISSPLRYNQDPSTKEFSPIGSPNQSHIEEKDRPRTPGIVLPTVTRSRDEHSEKPLQAPIEKVFTVIPAVEKVEEVRGQSKTEFDVPDALANVEEMLDGFEWRRISSADPTAEIHRSLTQIGGPGPMNRIEQQLLSELKALELAEIHAIIENDDRVGMIVTYLDESLAELEKMEALLSLYKTQLNMVSEDVTHIESQNRGFQVQISNQRALLEEIEDIMQTIRIPESALDALAQEPLDSQKGISNLEKATTSLYRAILSVRDLNNVAAIAASEDKVEQYKRNAQQFCKRIYEFLVVMFKYQAELVSNDPNNLKLKNDLKAPSHTTMEKYLERYCGLTLFIKEIDSFRYRQLCAAYFATVSQLHKQEFQDLIALYRNIIRKPNEEELEAIFAGQSLATNSKAITSRKPVTKSEKRDKKELGNPSETLTAGEAFQRFLVQLIRHLQREQNFVVDFLHIQSGLNDGEVLITYADYVGLEGYFRRAALNHLQKEMSSNKFKDILSVMDLVFGFLPGELKEWVEALIARDPMQIVGLMVALDLVLASDDVKRNKFVTKMLEGQQRRALNVFEKNVKDQLKAIETTQLTVKKRKGVVSFISIFPEFVSRVERQLEFAPNATSPTRKLIDKVYDQIVHAMFESLQTMAKSEEDGTAPSSTSGGSQEDRDKNRLNYHTLIIENMHHFVTTVSKFNSAALKACLEKAKEQYDQNLTLYIRLVLRRPFARFIDYFQGIEEMLRTTSPSEISQLGQFTLASLKRVMTSLDKKDLKKAIEALSKRIDKHFNDVANPSAENSIVMETVWKACEKELARLIEGWKQLLNKCYESPTHDSGNSSQVPGFEFGVEDVHLAFQKYRPGV